MLASFALHAQQAEAPAWQPEVLFSFTGADGGHPGATAFTAPVWNAQEQRLYGVTRGGGTTYKILRFGFEFDMTSGRAYGFDPDGTGFQSWTLGGVMGDPLTNLALDSAGRVVAGGQTTVRDPAATAANVSGFRMFGIKEDAVAPFDEPSQVLLDRGLSPRGAMAADDAGNVYFGADVSYFCNATQSDKWLYRRTAAGAIEGVVNFCDFTDKLKTSWSFRKGGVPQVLAYSKSDGALYIVSSLSANNDATFYPDLVTGTEKVNGFLVRIGKAALAKTQLAEDDIEVLHVFKSDVGLPSSATDGAHTALVEDGDWLYGTGPSMLWRLRKSDPDASFAVVHAFASNVISEPLEDDAGISPMGDLVRALDGNIYGTTMSDGTRLNATGNRAGGYGSLFRVAVGTAADRSDDRIEFLHYFDADADGSIPVGLAAGPVEAGKQWLFGATQGGLADNGGVYRVGIDVPEVVITRFAAASSSLKTGQAPTLSWTSEQASACTAGGDWSGDKGAQGEETLPAIATAGTYTYTLQCAGPTGESTVAEAVVTVEADDTGSGGDGGANDGNGGGSSGGGGGPLGWELLLALGLLGAAGRRRG
jgi:hypothetical protein